MEISPTELQELIAASTAHALGALVKAKTEPAPENNTEDTISEGTLQSSFDLGEWPDKSAVSASSIETVAVAVDVVATVAENDPVVAEDVEEDVEEDLYHLEKMGQIFMPDSLKVLAREKTELIFGKQQDAAKELDMSEGSVSSILSGSQPTRGRTLLSFMSALGLRKEALDFLKATHYERYTEPLYGRDARPEVVVAQTAIQRLKENQKIKDGLSETELAFSDIKMTAPAIGEPVDLSRLNTQRYFECDGSNAHLDKLAVKPSLEIRKIVLNEYKNQSNKKDLNIDMSGVSDRLLVKSYAGKKVFYTPDLGVVSTFLNGKEALPLRDVKYIFAFVGREDLLGSLNGGSPRIVI